MIKICSVCGKEFEDKKHKDKKFCSIKCYGIAQRKNKELTCDYCGKKFYKSPSLVKNSNKVYCSNECRYLANKKQDVIYYENNYAYILLIKDNVSKKVFFDIEDVEKVKQYKWHLHLRKSDMRYDACTNRFGKHIKGRYMLMSRYLMNYSGNLTIDHINRNPLDNRKSNLRIVTQFENNQNLGNNKSGCVGVCWDKNRNKWHVMIKNKNLGRFDNFKEAVKVRKQAEKEYLNS